MKQEIHYQYDIVIIGKGISGLAAAIEAGRKGASVAVIYDSNVSSTSLAYQGVFRLSENSEELHKKVSKYGCGLAKSKLLGDFFKAYKESLYDSLESTFSLVNAMPIGKKHSSGGPGILQDLETLSHLSNIQFFNGKTMNICTSGGAVSVVQVFRFPRLITFATKCCIIATGGGLGNIYHSTDNITSYCTPGAILALNAGAQLRDLEFISFHPLGVIGLDTYHKTTPIFTFFTIGTKTKIYSKTTDKRVSFIEDLISSRTPENNAHDNVFQIAQEVWRNGGVYFFKGIRDNQRRFDVKVVAHSLIGGIDTNLNFETSINNLFAIGEAAGGLNGAGCLPGMALLEGFISGIKAGETASIRADSNSFQPIDTEDFIPSATRFGMFSSLPDEIRIIADAAVFIERTEQDLLYNREKLRNIKSKIVKKESAQYIEYDLAEMVLAIIEASLLRKESRGFFFRKDHPDSVPTMEKNILIKKNDPKSEIEAFWG